jgi:putative ABC transport system ATP-binding protein
MTITARTGRSPRSAFMPLAVDPELFRIDTVVRWLHAAEPRFVRSRASGTRDRRDQTAPAGSGASAAAMAPAGGENTTMSFLELRDVSRSYGEGSAKVNALHEVSLSVDQGELVAVMGPSGSGKSTLLTIAGTLEEPNRGEVLVGGQPVGAMSRSARARLRRRTIGYVFQDFNLLPGLTAAENVALPLELDGTPARKARAAALESLGRLGLGERALHYPDQLSGGERQRVAIARAMVGERKLLLADEPSGALDSVNGEAVMQLIHDACKKAGMAAVVVTHDAQLAGWADRMLFLRDGYVTGQSRPVEGPEARLTPEAGK